jgi:hypothetical protein
MDRPKHPRPHERGWELWLYRRRRRGDTLTVAENEHLDRLAPWYPRLEEMAKQHDEHDKLVRAEIAKYPHGYGWHNGRGQGLPFDWSDSELAHLRPHDWTVRARAGARVAPARLAAPIRELGRRFRPPSSTYCLALQLTLPESQVSVTAPAASCSVALNVQAPDTFVPDELKVPLMVPSRSVVVPSGFRCTTGPKDALNLPRLMASLV